MEGSWGMSGGTLRIGVRVRVGVDGSSGSTSMTGYERIGDVKRSYLSLLFF
jgi:hypothetical protein